VAEAVDSAAEAEAVSAEVVDVAVGAEAGDKT